MNVRKPLLASLTASTALFGVLLTGVGTASAAPATASSGTTTSAAAPTQALSIPVTGTFTDALGGVGTMTGTFVPTGFSNQNGQLVTTGTLTCTLTDSLGNVLGTVTQSVTAPTAVTATCQVLNLDLGPLHLDLLGLVVDLAPVHLTITADQAPGALLGNLLCAVSHLLDNTGGLGGTLDGLVALLNQILAAL